ncbi:MAG: hypothetical protein JWO15_959 [Sphingomonadales bacterium]|nr:hypothetical protein [Sphingomonadales bacterium]
MEAEELDDVAATLVWAIAGATYVQSAEIIVLPRRQHLARLLDIKTPIFDSLMIDSSGRSLCDSLTVCRDCIEKGVMQRAIVIEAESKKSCTRPLHHAVSSDVHPVF